jgi:hypothetical protein
MTTTLTQPLPGATLPTYAEVKGENPFDWHAFLAKDNHPEDEWHFAINLAGAWVTCACGNQCSALPRFANGVPEDETLQFLGEDFAQEIRHKDWPGARVTLARIEQRAALLLTTQAALAKECNTCAGLGCPNCHGGANGKGQANA